MELSSKEAQVVGQIEKILAPHPRSVRQETLQRVRSQLATEGLITATTPEMMAKAKKAAQDAGYKDGAEAARATIPEIVQEIRRANPGISQSGERKLLLKEMKRLKHELNQHHGGLDDLKRRQARLLKMKEMSEALQVDWSKPPFTLSKAEGSRLHMLRSASGTLKLYSVFETMQGAEDQYGAIKDAVDGAHSFVIEHDWGAAFANAVDFDAPMFRLPADVCAFEFQIKGKRVIALALHTADDDTSEIIMEPIIQIDDAWAEFGVLFRYSGGVWRAEVPDYRLSGLGEFLGSQIKAVTVALDAEVAEVETVRQPHKLVKARLREGKIPPADYSVVSLTRRARAKPLERGEPTGRRVRLHFRRGHWRHFQTHKTWIRWMLVGDPDLGFIDKHYRL